MVIVASDHTQLSTPHSVGLLWTRDRIIAGTSTSKHSIFTTDKHPHPGGIRTRNHNNQAAKTYALEGVVTGIAITVITMIKIIIPKISSELDISTFKVIIFISTKLHNITLKKID